MPLAERLRQILPFAVALYLAANVAQVQATHAAFPSARGGIALGDVVSGIKWHMLEVAKNEQAETFATFPGN